MKSKIFTGERWDSVEKQAFDWLAAQKPNLELHHLETFIRVPVHVTLWYEVVRRPVSPHRLHRTAVRQCGRTVTKPAWQTCR